MSQQTILKNAKLTTRIFSWGDDDVKSVPVQKKIKEFFLKTRQELPDVKIKIFHAGDTGYGNYEEWIENHKNVWTAEEVAEYHDITKGNHDCIKSEKNDDQLALELYYKKYYQKRYQNADEAAYKKNILKNQWLDGYVLGRTYLLNLDSEDADKRFKDRTQMKFLEEKTIEVEKLRAEGKIDFVIVFTHRPYFTMKSSHDPETDLRFLYLPFFKRMQVNLIIHGHNHNFQAWKQMIPSESDANSEGKQLFVTITVDGIEIIDNDKEHGWSTWINGDGSHEWNAITEDGKAIENVYKYIDEGKFGFSQFDVYEDDVYAYLHLQHFDVDGKMSFEYPLIRQTKSGSTTPPPPPPECIEPNMCIDNVTGQCRQLAENEFKDVNTKKCMPNIGPPPPPDQDIKDPHCDDGYTLKIIDGKCKCVKDNTIPPPPPDDELQYYYNVEAKKWIPKLNQDEPTAAENKPPIVNAGEDKEVKEDETISLNGSKSYDPEDGSIPTNGLLGFLWTQTKGNPQVQLQNANAPVASFVSPKVPEGQEKNELEFMLEVTDSKGAKGRDKALITVTKGGGNPPPPPMGNLIYSTFMHLVNGQDFTVNDTFGNQEPDGKGIYCAASGDPFVEVKKDGTVWLCCKSGGHPRFYIKVNNYNYKESGWKMFPNKDPDDFNTKGRNRHNMGGDCDNRQGGVGFVHQLPNKIDSSCEICHNTRMGSVEGDTSKNYEMGKWYYFENYLCDVEGGQTRRIAKIDMNGRDTLPQRDEVGTNLETVFDDVIKLPDSFYKKEMFDKESEAWHRMNPAKGTKAGLFDYKIFKIESTDLPPKE